MEQTKPSIDTKEYFPLVQLPERVPVAMPFRGELAEEAVKYVFEQKEKLGNPAALQGYFKLNEETGEINGSTLFHMILLNKFLQQHGLRTLNYAEGKQLDKAKKLTNGVWRDFEVIAYSPQGNNEELAKALAKDIKHRNLEYPVVLHPVSLDMKNGKTQYGVTLSILDNPTGIVSGEQAQAIIESLDWKGNSGVQRLYRNWDGYWAGVWNDLAYSYEVGRVDWVRGEATRADLSNVGEIEKEYKKGLEKMLAEAASRKERALRVLQGKE